jgi:tetratricopeptide (TPR) repeat protein
MAKGSDFYYTQGILARNARDLDGALELLKKAVEVNPKNVDAWMEIGGIYFDKRLFEKEISAFQKAVEADPKNYDAHSYLGSAYEDQGFYDRAMEQYKEALKIQPDDVESREKLVLLMIMNKDKLNALREYEMLQKLNPGVAKKVKRLIEMIG